MKAVKITWIDSQEITHWHHKSDIEDALGCSLIESIGHVVKENKTYISIAGHISSDKDSSMCGVMSIPKCSIKEIKEINNKESDE